MSSDIDIPRAVVGDFNSLLHDHEINKRPTRSAIRCMSSFKNTVHECDLINAGFQGYPYTWHHGDLEERLDRMLMNIHCRIRFPEGTIFHLPPFKSDHRPLLIQFLADWVENIRRRRPFRFLAAWLTHEDFLRFMRCKWQRNLPWNHQMQQFKPDLERRNKEVFGNIFARKRKLMHKLENVSAQVNVANTHYLKSRQQAPWKEYEEVLGQEEILWFQKYRSR